MIIKTERGIFSVTHVEILSLKEPVIRFICPDKVKFSKTFKTVDDAKTVLNEIYDKLKKEPMELNNDWVQGINY